MSTNTTVEVGALITSFGAGIGVVPLIMYIESIAVAKALAMRNKYKVDASQELIAIGASNIFVSFFKGFPVTGSFARSALNSASGAATPFSGVLYFVFISFDKPCAELNRTTRNTVVLTLFYCSL